MRTSGHLDGISHPSHELKRLHGYSVAANSSTPQQVEP